MFRLVRQSVKCMMLIKMPCLDFSSIGPSHNHRYCVKKKYKENLFRDLDCFKNTIRKKTGLKFLHFLKHTAYMYL